MCAGAWLVKQFTPVGALLHLLAGGRVDRCAAGVPAAAQGLVQRHQAADRIAATDQIAVLLLQQVPYKGSLPTAVPTDPLIYRFYELVSVYGTTFKELIHEEFGDGIMSAIDFKMDMKREPDPNGDRVKIVMSGKYLSYKTY